MSARYYNSEALLEQALKVIPLGSQTFSKSKIQYPHGVSPYFIAKGLGSKVWDVDGNEYIDFVNALAAVTLGHCDSDVTLAVQTQLAEGTIFSLAHPIEVKVAELIVELVPCAEQVRFGKNGSDATAGAIRLARAFTGRDLVAVAGYHGWQDWYIGSTTRHLGVPNAVRELTHTFQYNNIESLHQLLTQYPHQFAAIVLEPLSGNGPENHFLQKVKELTHQQGALLIFDEVVTGFRCALGGAQEYFGVIPDLVALGKGLANGYPLSAVAGRHDVMRYMEDIFFSFTFGGETLSLAAALATLTKLKTQPVIQTLQTQGQKIINGVKSLALQYKVNDFIDIGGYAAQPGLMIRDTPHYSQWQIRTLILQEFFARNILCIGGHNMSYAHSNEDIAQLLRVYEDVFNILYEVVSHHSLDSYLKCEPLVPLFSLRKS